MKTKSPLEARYSGPCKRQIKKLDPNSRKTVKAAIQSVLHDPSIGEQKKGDLARIRVHKFRVSAQLFLLAYEVHADHILFDFLGSHENFYRDLKKHIK